MKLLLTIPVMLCMHWALSIHRHQNKAGKAYMQGATVSDSSLRKTLIEDLRKFRDAVYRKDTAAVKSFFNFPVKNPNNEIWYLLLNEKQLQQRKIGEKPVPFTEKDFRVYYSKLFPAEFVKTFLKIKTATLLTADETQTPALPMENSTGVTMYVSYDAAEKTLSLNLNYKNSDTESDDAGESSVIYFFSVLPNGHLMFQKIMLAG